MTREFLTPLLPETFTVSGRTVRWDAATQADVDELLHHATAELTRAGGLQQGWQRTVRDAEIAQLLFTPTTRRGATVGVLLGRFLDSRGAFALLERLQRDSLLLSAVAGKIQDAGRRYDRGTCSADELDLARVTRQTLDDWAQGKAELSRAEKLVDSYLATGRLG